MPKIDPLQLLNCLKVLLSENGGIGSAKNVSRVAGLMNKYSKKLVSKCIYIQILKCTNTDLLEMFMSANGWDLVYNWLVDAITKNNWILVQEILELFLLCPVDTTRLKSNAAPKVVKNLSINGGTSVVKHLATKLVDQWLYIVKSQTPSVQSTRTPELIPAVSESQEAPATNSSGSIKILLKDGKQVLAKINVEKSSAPVASDEGSNSPSQESEKDEVDEAVVKEKKEEKSSKSSSSSSSSSSSKSRHKSSSSSSSSSSSKKSSSSSSSSSKSSSSSSSDKDKHRSSSSKSSSSKSSSSDKDRHRSSSKSSRDDKDRHRSKDKSSSSRDKSSSSSSKDKDYKSDKDKTSERDKILEKLAKITKKSKEEDSPTSITVPSKKASISIEIKKDAEKSSAVKTYKSQFRSHGLTEEAPPPPSRKGLKKPLTQPIVIPPPILPAPTLSLKRTSPPPKESPTEKRAKIDIISSSPTSVPEKVGGVKLIAPKPKPSALVETNLFSDALSASMAPKKDARKRKLKTKDAPAEPESPQKTVAPLKFYQDTLDEKKEDASKADQTSSPKTEDSKDDDDDEDDIPLKKVKEDIKKKEEASKETTPPVSPEEKSKDNEEPEIEEPIVKPPGPGCGPNGPPGVLSIHRRKGPKKKLTWKPEAELEQIRYFESDENERVNVTKTSFMDMKQMERCSERDAMMIGKKFNPNDNMVEQMEWIKPYEIDGDIPVHPMGSNSKEKLIQQEREKNTLKTIYFSVGMIPDSPAEPEFEHYVPSEPVSIPIDDVTGNPDTVNDFTGMAWPEAKLGGGEDVIALSAANENPFKPINNPFSSNTFMPFPQQNDSNIWMNQVQGVPPLGMQSGPPIHGPPMNMNGPPMNMNGPPMRPPQFFNGPGPGPGPNQFGGPPPNFNPNMMMNNFNGPPPPQNPMNFPQNGPPNFGNNRRNDRGGWRGPNNENWRNGPPAGPGGPPGPGPRGMPMNRGPPPPNWVNNNVNMSNNNNKNGGGPPRGVCKQFLRGNCRNNRCNFIHPKKF